MRVTIDIEDTIWKAFQKLLVELYGSAYGKKKRESINEALMLWIKQKSKHPKKEQQNTEEVLNQFAPGRKIHPIILEIIGKTETILSDEDLRKLIPKYIWR